MSGGPGGGARAARAEVSPSRAHFDPLCGASGDMILAALVDAGAPLEEIHRLLATLALPPFTLEAEEVRSGGLRGRRLHLELPREGKMPGLADVEELLGAGELPPQAVERACAVFERLARAEARAHGVSLGEVHFHEVGALDSIVDVAGSVLALELLGVEEVTFSPLRVGTGEVETAHGTMPVPVPAVLELVRDIPIVRTAIPTEILTPTGAALLATLGRPEAGEPFVARAVGVGCGRKELPGRANVLRVCLGRRFAPESSCAPARAHEAWEADEVAVLETNVDDLSPEIFPSVIEEVLSAGAWDAFLVPIVMKRGRPGHLLTVLVAPEREVGVAAVLFRETSTFGIRRGRWPRWKLARERREIETPWGPVQVKVGRLGGGELRVTPEYASCRAIADRTGMPLQEAYRAVEAHIRSCEWVGGRGANS